MNLRFPRMIILVLILIMLIAGCQRSTQPTGLPVETQEPILPTATETTAEAEKWWHGAVFYEIFVRSFYDSNGDGIGDFVGLTQKLDYLNDGDPNTNTDLGVTALWLMPIFPSSSYHGYDVMDYYSVNPQFGTMEEFKTLLAEAHKRGIRIIIDYVINHTSVNHPWFQAALKDPNSPYVDYYIWSQTDLSYPGPWGQVVWHKASNGMYYYGVFWSGMPDLNYRSQAVRDEINKITSFWLKDVGVDGFRIDGARHLIEDGQIQSNSEDTHAYFKEFNQFVKSINPEAMIVGEIWDGSFAASQYVKNQEMDLVFGFDLADGIISSVHQPDAKLVGFWLTSELRQYPTNTLATFLTNHDINRVANQFMGNQEKMKNAGMVLLTSPGIPFIYYGEEIGMFGAKPDEMIRTPMQWSAAQHGGFTTGSPWESVNSDYPEVNVESQSADPESIFNLYRSLIQLRQKTPALQFGDFASLPTGSSRVYAVVREYQGKSLLVLINMGDKPVSDYGIDLKFNQAPGNYVLQPLFGSGDLATVTLDADGTMPDYRPLEELPANLRLVLELVPVN